MWVLGWAGVWLGAEPPGLEPGPRSTGPEADPCPQVALETTIGNRNEALWKYVRPQGCVLEWIRNVVANRLALDGASWTDVFKRFNSGT